jgi:diamine N-acetyltransferase
MLMLIDLIWHLLKIKSLLWSCAAVRTNRQIAFGRQLRTETCRPGPTTDRHFNYPKSKRKTSDLVSTIMNNIVYGKPTESDIASVAAFAKQSFRDTFFESAGYDEDEFVDFIDKEYSVETLSEWIHDSEKYGFFMATFSEGDKNKCIGFVLVGGPSKLPTDENDYATTSEVYKLYVSDECKGKGIAQKLMEMGLNWIKESTIYTSDLFIGVWSKNIRAQKFYGKYQAVKIAEYLYPVGETNDEEFIMRIKRAEIR